MAFESSTDRNQSEVYKRTHNVGKLNKKGICERASRLMKNCNIVARISELRRPVVERFKVHHEAWLERLRSMAFADIGRLFDTHGNPIDIPDLPPEAKAVIAGFEVQELFVGKKEDESRVAAGYTKKYKLVNPLDAMEMFGKACGFFPNEKESILAAKLKLEEEGDTVKRSIEVTFVHAPPRPSFTPEEHV